MHLLDHLESRSVATLFHKHFDLVKCASFRPGRAEHRRCLCSVRRHSPVSIADLFDVAGFPPLLVSELRCHCAWATVLRAMAVYYYEVGVVLLE